MGNTLLEKQHMNDEIELANTVINLLVLLLAEFAGPCRRAGTIYFLITPSKMFLHMSAALMHSIKEKKSDQSMFLPSVSFLAFFKSWNRDSTNWRKTWHLTGCFFVKPVWVRAFLYLAFCKYIFTQTEIIISHVRHGGKFPFSAGAAGIKIILLNGTGLLEASCGPRIKLCWHPNMRDMRRSADQISWKACLMASVFGNKYPQ